jgi:hypothetical protein
MILLAISLLITIILVIIIPGWLWSNIFIEDFSKKEVAVQTGWSISLGLAIVPGFLYFVNVVFSVPLGVREIIYLVSLLTLAPLAILWIRRYGGPHSLLRRCAEILESLR